MMYPTVGFYDRRPVKLWMEDGPVPGRFTGTSGHDDNRLEPDRFGSYRVKGDVTFPRTFPLPRPGQTFCMEAGDYAFPVLTQSLRHNSDEFDTVSVGVRSCGEPVPIPSTRDPFIGDLLDAKRKNGYCMASIRPIDSLSSTDLRFTIEKTEPLVGTVEAGLTMASAYLDGQRAYEVTILGRSIVMDFVGRDGHTARLQSRPTSWPVDVESGGFFRSTFYCEAKT